MGFGKVSCPYCGRLDSDKERMAAAENLLDRAARAGDLTPGGWLQLQLEIVGFLNHHNENSPSTDREK
jgi:hypothetical protein